MTDYMTEFREVRAKLSRAEQRVAAIFEKQGAERQELEAARQRLAYLDQKLERPLTSQFKARAELEKRMANLCGPWKPYGNRPGSYALYHCMHNPHPTFDDVAWLRIVGPYDGNFHWCLDIYDPQFKSYDYGPRADFASLLPLADEALAWANQILLKAGIYVVKPEEAAEVLEAQ